MLLCWSAVLTRPDKTSGYLKDRSNCQVPFLFVFEKIFAASVCCTRVAVRWKTNDHLATLIYNCEWTSPSFNQTSRLMWHKGELLILLGKAFYLDYVELFGVAPGTGSRWGARLGLSLIAPSQLLRWVMKRLDVHLLYFDSAVFVYLQAKGIAVHLPLLIYVGKSL